MSSTTTTKALLAQGGAPSAGGSGWIQFLPLLLILVIFYFLLIRPVRQRQKRHQELLDSLKNGDKVVTQGGIRGTVVGIGDEVVHVRVAQDVKIEVNKSAVVGLQGEPELKS